MNDEQIIALMKDHGINWSDGGRGDWGYSIGSFDRMSMGEARSILQAARATPSDHSVPMAKPLMWVRLDSDGDILAYSNVEEEDYIPVYAQPPQNAADHIEAQSVRDACKHEFEPLVGPHKECVLCGDVRKDQERKILDGYDDWCKQFIADFGYTPDVLDAFEGGKNNTPKKDAAMKSASVTQRDGK